MAYPERAQSARRAALLVAALLVLFASHRFGLFQQFADPARAARALKALGAWGYVAFIAAYTVLQPVGIPGTVFVVAAPLIWPWPIAFALSMIGTMGASVVGFSLARYVARDAVRDWLVPRIPARFRRYEQALATRGFATVFWLRFVFWMPQVLHTFLGVSRVSFATHFWGSLAGYVLPILVVSYFGQAAFDALARAPRELWLGALALIVIVSAAWFVRAHRRAREPFTNES